MSTAARAGPAIKSGDRSSVSPVVEGHKYVDQHLPPGVCTSRKLGLTVE